MQVKWKIMAKEFVSNYFESGKWKSRDSNLDRSLSAFYYPNDYSEIFDLPVGFIIINLKP